MQALPKLRILYRLTLGFVFGYASYCLLVVFYELYRDVQYGARFDGEHVVHFWIFPIGILDLFMGDWRVFWRDLMPGDVLCYSLIVFWSWWFLRGSSLRKFYPKKNDD